MTSKWQGKLKKIEQFLIEISTNFFFLIISEENTELLPIFCQNSTELKLNCLENEIIIDYVCLSKIEYKKNLPINELCRDNNSTLADFRAMTTKKVFQYINNQFGSFVFVIGLNIFVLISF